MVAGGMEGRLLNSELSDQSPSVRQAKGASEREDIDFEKTRSMVA